MHVIKARQTRTLLLRLDREEDLIASLAHALADAEVTSGWVRGTGIVEAAEVAVLAPSPTTPTPTAPTTLAVATRSTLISLTGSIASLADAPTPRLTAMFARTTETGLEVYGGELISARVYSVELCVDVYDDLALYREFDESTGLPRLAEAPPAVAAAPAVAPPRLAVVAPIEPPPATPAEPTRATLSAGDIIPTASSYTPAVLPTRPPRRESAAESAVYPEAGDIIVHFHFGDCIVVDSDGDRLRLRQAPDGRVREVALAMLTVSGPEVDASGKRTFRLTRKR